MYRIIGKVGLLLLLCFAGEFCTHQFKSVPEEKVVKKDVYVQVQSKRVHKEILLEEYLIGVVASEMPYTFEMEALKAQSVAARTFVLSRKLKVDDTTSTQVFKSEEQLQEIYEESYDNMYERIKEAVDSTKGEVMVYDDTYISALFHSSNNGKTNDSSWYFGGKKPYLKSVDSKWDRQYEGSKKMVRMKKSGVLKALNLSYFEIGDCCYYESGYVKEIYISGKKFSGREIRELLQLRSSCFTLKDLGEEIEITCEGYGHGVGMSQHGANGMAKEGFTYKEILKHYYQGVQIVQFDE